MPHAGFFKSNDAIPAPFLAHAQTFDRGSAMSSRMKPWKNGTRHVFKMAEDEILLLLLRGVTILTNAVSCRSQNCSRNVEISPGIGTLGKFSGKHAIIPALCRKKSGHRRKFYFMYPKNLGRCSKFPVRLKLIPSIARTAFVRVVVPRCFCWGSRIGGRTFRKPPNFVPLPETANRFRFLLKTDTAPNQSFNST